MGGRSCFITSGAFGHGLLHIWEPYWWGHITLPDLASGDPNQYCSRIQVLQCAVAPAASLTLAPGTHSRFLGWQSALPAAGLRPIGIAEVQLHTLEVPSWKVFMKGNFCHNSHLIHCHSNVKFFLGVWFLFNTSYSSYLSLNLPLIHPQVERKRAAATEWPDHGQQGDQQAEGEHQAGWQQQWGEGGGGQGQAPASLQCLPGSSQSKVSPWGEGQTALARLGSSASASVLKCKSSSATVFKCFSLQVLKSTSATVFKCYSLQVLQSSSATVYKCYWSATVLKCYSL